MMRLSAGVRARDRQIDRQIETRTYLMRPSTRMTRTMAFPLWCAFPDLVPLSPPHAPPLDATPTFILLQ